MNERAKLIWIDAAKGLSVALLVCMHTNAIFQNRMSPSNLGVTWWIHCFINTACRVCIPLFFMLSGAVILGAPEKSLIDRKYVRRVGRTLIPFVFWSLTYLLVYRLTLSRMPTLNDVVGIVTGKVHYHLWFLSSLTGLLIISPMLNAYVCATGNKGALILGCLLLSVVGTAWVLENSIKFQIEPNLTRVLPVYSGYFVIGYALRDYPVTKTKKLIAAATYLIGLVVCAILARSVNSRASQFDGLIGDYLNPLVMIMSIAMFLLLRPLESAIEVQHSGRVTTFFVWLGVASLGIYALHVMILENFLQFAFIYNRLGFRRLPNVAIVLIVTLIVTAVSSGLSTLARRVPVLQRLA